MENRTYLAQGEVNFYPLPADADMTGAALAAEGGRLIVGHSETGHNHVIDADRVTAVVVSESEGLRILRLIVKEPTNVEHLRPFDTHAPVSLAPGNWEVRISREYDPYAELSRQVAD